MDKFITAIIMTVGALAGAMILGAFTSLITGSAFWLIWNFIAVPLSGSLAFPPLGFLLCWAIAWCVRILTDSGSSNSASEEN